MRAKLLAAAGAGAMALVSAAEARAEDWRVVLPYFGGDIHMVDVDSVVRRPGGLISMRAQVRADPKETRRAESWDRYDLVVSGRCPPAASDRDYEGRLDLAYYQAGRRVAAPPAEDEQDWGGDDAGAGDGAGAGEDEYREGQFIADSVCAGSVGYRGFASPEAVTAALTAGRSAEWVSGYESDETELVGTVIQGFEANVVVLCGSEAGCSPGAATELCWLEGPIRVPVPAGAAEWNGGAPRRDSEVLAFRGRIVRSFLGAGFGTGFGHMGAYGCLVRASESGRPATLPGDAEERREFGAAGRTAEALAAHQAVAAAISTAAGTAGLTLTAEAKKWTIDALQAEAPAHNSRGACASYWLFAGQAVAGEAPWILWSDVVEVEREGAAVTVSMKVGSEALDFRLGTPAAAAGLKGLHQRVRDGRASGIGQRGRQVTFVLAAGGRETLSYPDAARAVEAAAIAEEFRARGVVASGADANSYSGSVRGRVTVTFPAAAQAQAAEERMRALWEVCKGG